MKSCLIFGKQERLFAKFRASHLRPKPKTYSLIDWLTKNRIASPIDDINQPR